MVILIPARTFIKPHLVGTRNGLRTECSPSLFIENHVLKTFSEEGDAFVPCT